jgi:hypothetical protein
MNQRTATVQTILGVLKERGVNYELGGSKSVSEVLTDEDRAKVRQLIIAGFKGNRIEMAEESKSKYLSDDKALSAYVSGLVNNWIRKAPEFNGGAKYQAKNPGSRAGSQDEAIAEMTKLLKQTNDPKVKATIQAEIDSRKAELFYSKQPQIDVSKLPAHLRQYVK